MAQLRGKAASTLVDWRSADASVQHASSRLDAAKEKVAEETERLTKWKEQLQAEEQARVQAQNEVDVMSDVRAVFGKRGVQHFQLQSVVRDLSTFSRTFLEHLSSSFEFSLEMQRAEASAKQETIRKQLTRVHDGHVLQRDLDLGSLSTGERRRVALALTLGYLRLLQARGRCTSNVLILDEVHTNLDGEGIERVVALLRKLPQATVLMVGQANSDLIDLADHQLEVVKHAGAGCSLHSLF